MDGGKPLFSLWDAMQKSGELVDEGDC